MRYINTTTCTAQPEDKADNPRMKTEPQKNIYLHKLKLSNLETNTRWHKCSPEITCSSLCKSNAKAKMTVSFSILIDFTHHCPTTHHFSFIVLDTGQINAIFMPEYSSEFLPWQDLTIKQLYRDEQKMMSVQYADHITKLLKNGKTSEQINIAFFMFLLNPNVLSTC